MSRAQRDRALASHPFGPRNVRLDATAGETNDLPHRHDDGDLHLRFVDGFDGLVILAVDRPAPAEQRPLATTSRAATPLPSPLRHQLQRFLSFLR